MQASRSGSADLCVIRLEWEDPRDTDTARKTDATMHVVPNIMATTTPRNKLRGAKDLTLPLTGMCDYAPIPHLVTSRVAVINLETGSHNPINC
jgi:hypothetical protein